jgi:CheY-like chemotaxis protein
MGSKATRVLVVEDQDYLREMVVDILSEFGYPAVGIADPFTALTQAAALMPELVVLDMWMPTMSGLAFIARLRREPRFAALPVIVVSGDRGVSLDELGDAHVEFMLKPFEASVLVERTRALIGPPLCVSA